MRNATKRVRPMGPKALTGSPDARRTAAVILEVLSGERDTVAASQELGVTLARYYVLETRAVQGLIGALEPRKRGRVRSPENELEATKGEKAKLEREVARLQALVRASQRAIGITATPEPAKGRKVAGTGRRRRRHTMRAMRVVRALRTGVETAKSAAVKAEPKPEARPPAAGA